MFGDTERTDSDMHEDDERDLKALLKDFGAVVHESLDEHALESKHNPFGKPSNVLVVIDPENVHLVVDGGPVEGAPFHVYRNETVKGLLIPIEGVVQAAVRDIGFRDPVAISLPGPLLHMPGEERLGALRRSIRPVMEQIKKAAGS